MKLGFVTEAASCAVTKIAKRISLTSLKTKRLSKVTYIPLTDTPRALREHGISVSYHSLWRAAVEGRIPTAKQNGRWMVNTTEVETIARHFALVKQ